jgi:hypothetical protein
MAIGQDLHNVPMGEMIYSMASAIAQSQLELDRASVETAEMMGGLKTITDDQGNIQFTDSRVYFGQEYMTVVDAWVSQGEGNPVVKQLVAAATLTYGAYAPAGGDLNAPTEGNAIPTVATGAGGNFSATNVAAYQTQMKVIRDRIGVLEGRIPSVTGTPLTTLTQRINDLRTLERNNKAAVAGIFEAQVPVPTRLSLLELGFAPVFYAFVDTIIEVKISISITTESSSTTTTENTGRSVQGNIGFSGIPFLRGRMNRTREVSTSQVNATYSNRYSYTAEGSSLLRTKLSPVPTPAILEERIRAAMAAEQARKAAELGLLTAVAAA